MFAIDKDRLKLLFTIDDRDLALIFADMEGYVVRREDRGQPATPLPVSFGSRRRTDCHGGAVPEQVRPGIFAYRLTRLRSSDLDERMLRLLRSQPGERASTYAGLLGLGQSATTALLTRLRRQKLVEASWIQKTKGGDRVRGWAPYDWNMGAVPSTAAPRRLEPQARSRFAGQRRDEGGSTLHVR